MRRIALWAFLAATGALLLADGCGSSHDVVNLQNSDSGRSMAVAVGDEVDVTLQTIGPGQYGTPSLSSSSVKFVGVSSVGAPNPGGPKQLFRFAATGAGRALLTIPHEGDLPEATTVPPFVLTIDVY